METGDIRREEQREKKRIKIKGESGERRRKKER